jgi:hypothetical protein
VSSEKKYCNMNKRKIIISTLFVVVAQWTCYLSRKTSCPGWNFFEKGTNVL